MHGQEKIGACWHSLVGKGEWQLASVRIVSCDCFLRVLEGCQYDHKSFFMLWEGALFGFIYDVVG